MKNSPEKTVKAKVAPKNGNRTLGPVSDLEKHLPSDWWRHLFNSLYLKTDGDVVENEESTRKELDHIIEIAGIKKNDFVLDLCCGQGRHTLGLARRGYVNLSGIDRSRYLVRLARKRASSERFDIDFHEGDARKFQTGKKFDHILFMGNSFGYFEHQKDDEEVLKRVAAALKENGTIVMDLVNGDWMKNNFEPRSWEWIDQHHFVCRERALSADNLRIVSREVITHSDKGVLADQFYAERLYTSDELSALLEKVGYREVVFHGDFSSESNRGQDLGMMGNRMFFTAKAPIRPAAPLSAAAPKRVTVLLGCPELPDRNKLEGVFNETDMETIARLKDGLSKIPGYKFDYFTNHNKLLGAFRENPPDLIFNLCDEGYLNDAFKELHVPAYLEMVNVPYTGAGPGTLALCFDKSLVAAIAVSLGVPTPSETYMGIDDNMTTLPGIFPALVKPSKADGSLGITQNAVVNNATELLAYTNWMREELGPCSILVQEYLSGPEYSIAVIGNPGHTYEILPPLEVDYSGLPKDLPKILGYESKWNPTSPYWSDIKYSEADIDENTRRQLYDYANALFGRLGCRDYARFDFRTDAKGQVKLLEVNPNPGWCWDGKLNMMASWGGFTYSELLEKILKAAEERIAAEAFVTR